MGDEISRETKSLEEEDVRGPPPPPPPPRSQTESTKDPRPVGPSSLPPTPLLSGGGGVIGPRIKEKGEWKAQVITPPVQTVLYMGPKQRILWNL